MIVPLSARGHTFGALTLAAAESERRFEAADLRLAQDLANRAALACGRNVQTEPSGCLYALRPSKISCA